MKNLFLKTATVMLLLANGAFMSNANAQVTIGDNKAPESFSLLELVSGDNKGLRLPQMTTAERDLMANAAFKASTLAMGLQIFNTTSKCVETWNGAVWIEQCAPVPNYVDISCNGGTAIRWAKFNVGEFGEFVDNETDLGKFYQWNRPTSWAATGSISGWDNSSPTGSTWATINDPCPDGWRVPTDVQLQCLINSGSTWTTQNGVNGRLFGTAPNQIFLPAAGYRSSSDGPHYEAGLGGNYWSSTDYNSYYAYYLYFYSGNAFLSDYYTKTHGFSVRCVAE